MQLIELRNIIIHAHYSETFALYQYLREDLKGRKDIKTGKGYERRNYTLDTNLLEHINGQIIELQFFLKKVRSGLYSDDGEQEENYHNEFKKLNLIDFKLMHTIEE